MTDESLIRDSVAETLMEMLSKHFFVIPVWGGARVFLHCYGLANRNWCQKVISVWVSNGVVTISEREKMSGVDFPLADPDFLCRITSFLGIFLNLTEIVDMQHDDAIRHEGSQ